MATDGDPDSKDLETARPSASSPSTFARREALKRLMGIALAPAAAMLGQGCGAAYNNWYQDSGLGYTNYTDVGYTNTPDGGYTNYSDYNSGSYTNYYVGYKNMYSNYYVAYKNTYTNYYVSYSNVYTNYYH